MAKNPPIAAILAADVVVYSRLMDQEEIIANGTDWRLLNELKRELKT